MIDYTIFREEIENLIIDSGISNVALENTYPDDTWTDYIRVIDKSIVSEQLEIGSDSQLAKRVLVFKIFIPKGTGTQLAREKANALVSMINEFESESIIFSSAEFDSEGEDEDSDFYVHSLMVPYDIFMG